MRHHLSSRTSWDIAETPYATAVREARAAASQTGQELYDLTASNPTACGFHYDEQAILSPLCHPDALNYQPTPCGIRIAREAVAAYYSDRGAQISPDHVLLTTSTSEAYSFLFRLLCDPGDELLVAQPSYPLFDFLADLDDVRLVPYPLFYDYGWHIDLHALARKITPRTRAILVVHPNNPTGHFTSLQERLHLQALCQQHGLALITDEVFLDYLLCKTPLENAASFSTGQHPVLTFTLSGISKVAGLPQMKAAWIVAQGPQPALAEAFGRLEVIADTFLSMNAPIQHALPHWLANLDGIQHQIKRRTRANLRHAREVCARNPLMDVLQVEGGWNAILRVPAAERDLDLTLWLLREQGIIVHPGSFYGMAPGGRIVISLLVPEDEFCRGFDRFSASLAQRLVQASNEEPK